MYMYIQSDILRIVRAGCHPVAIALTEVPGSIPGGCRFFTVLYS